MHALVHRVTYLTAYGYEIESESSDVQQIFPVDPTVVNNVGLMADNHFRCEIVSKFLLNTCINRQVSIDVLSTLGACATRHRRDDNEVASIPLTTGSVAEFHIEPMLSCVGDVDIMYHRSDHLAIPEGTAPPTHLPAEFHSRVKMFDIIDSEFPGYVYHAFVDRVTYLTAYGHEIESDNSDLP